MPTGSPTLATVSDRLMAAGCVAAEEEAEELLNAAPDDTVLEHFLRRREHGEPLAWITGTTVFCGHTVRVDPGVYVPRIQSEELAFRAGVLLATAGSGARAADLCTGSGAIAVHLAMAAPRAATVAVDVDHRAATCARRNAVPAVTGDLGDPLARHAFDVVTAVAPYVPSTAFEFLPTDVQRYEPRSALLGGDDGLDIVRQVVVSAAGLLRRGGWLMTELGGDQHKGLEPTLEAVGFGVVTAWFDGDGDLRGIAAQLRATAPA